VPSTKRTSAIQGLERNMQIVYSKVSEKSETKRIWIEGGRLAKAGFVFGEAYTVIYDHNKKQIKLELGLFGDRRVSGRKRMGEDHKTPIVDLCSSEITKFVGSTKKVKLTITDGCILIEWHHECQKRLSRESLFKEHIQKGEVSTGTLCAGGGISTAALHDGLLEGGITSKTKWCVDINLRYLEVADRNNHAIDDDTKLVVASIEELANDDLEPVDILNVSLPCDVHAKCAKAKKGLKVAEEDSDITAIVGLLSRVRCVNPSVIVSENVIEAKDSASYMIIKAEITRLGYRIQETILNEVVGGSIEERKRYWFVAVSNGLENFDISQAMNYPRIYSDVNECLESDAVTESLFKDNQGLKDKEVSDLANGKSFRMQFIERDAKSVGVMGKGYNRNRSTEPRLVRGDGKSRLFTVLEACRMRLIPENLIKGCLPTLGHEITGQSILYGHAWSLGMLLSSVR